MILENLRKFVKGICSNLYLASFELYWVYTVVTYLLLGVGNLFSLDQEG